MCCVVLLQERLGIDRLEFRLAECDDIGDEAASHMGACAPEKGHGRETFSKKLGRFLRDPSVWCAGFQLQWKKNQYTLARRWWKKCERGEPANDEELLSKFNAAGKRWRK